MPEPPSSEPEGGSAERRALHWAVASLVLPPVYVPLSILQWRRLPRPPAGPRAARLRRALGWLHGVDALLLVLLVITTVVRGAGPAADKPRIGISFDVAHAGPGARIREVVDGSPAAAAGVRAGDVIVSLEGATIEHFAEVAPRVAASTAGETLRLGLRRDGRDLELDVAPTTAALPAPPLWQPSSGACLEGTRFGDRATLATFALLLLLALVTRRRGAWIALTVPLALWLTRGVAFGVGEAACAELGGPARGVAMLVMSAWTLGLAACGLALLGLARRQCPPLPTLGPRVGRGVAAGLSLAYIFGGWIRWGLLFAVATTWLELQVPQTFPELWIAASSDWAERVWVFAIVALAAPVAEELVYRGALLPMLASVVSPVLAVVGSAALFALAHWESHDVHALYIFVIGAILGWARLRTGSLSPCIAAHMGLNALSSLLVWSTQ